MAPVKPMPMPHKQAELFRKASPLPGRLLLHAALLILLVSLSSSNFCFASRGGAAGQDVLLGPNGFDTKTGAADDVKQDNNQKGGGQAGAGRRGYPLANPNEARSFGGFLGNLLGEGPQVAPESSPGLAAGKMHPGSFSGSGGSGLDNESGLYQRSANGVNSWSGSMDQPGSSSTNYNNNNNNGGNSNNNSNQMVPVAGQMSTEGFAGNPPNVMLMGPGAAANTKSMMSITGMNGLGGSKIASSAGAAVTGLLNMFNQIRDSQTPGANKEQQKVNQSQEKSVEADNFAGMERAEAATAIEFITGFMQNFTSGGNNFVTLHDTLFVPMAILLLLPGAVLAQTKSIASQGFAVLGEISPWEGIIRPIIAIFLVMASGLIINYGIDVANALVQAIAAGYKQNFGSDMAFDAASLHVRAHPIRLPEENFGVIPSDVDTIMFNYFGNTPAAIMEGMLLSIKYEDPAVGLYLPPLDRASETVPYKVPFAREAFNAVNCGMAFVWVILCCVQECYLYYLYFVGPLIAALWVYPSQMLRQAFPNWVEGVVCVCMWSLFWATTVCLMACFRGVDDTGTVACSALLTLALLSAKTAFDFVGLAKEAGRDAVRIAERAGQALQAAREAKAQAAASGGGGGGGGQSSGGGGGGPSPSPG